MKPHVAIYFDDKEEKRKIDWSAKVLGVTASALVKLAIDEYLDNHKDEIVEKFEKDNPFSNPFS